MFAVALVAVATVAVAAIEIAVLSQLQQDADTKGCRTSQAVNASKGRCIKLDLQAENADADGTVADGEEEQDDDDDDDDE